MLCLWLTLYHTTPVPTFTPIPRDWIAPAVLSQAYERNELVANQQYQGKRLKVSGQVETVRWNPSGVPYIEFVDASPIGAYYLNTVGPDRRYYRQARQLWTSAALAGQSGLQSLSVGLFRIRGNQIDKVLRIISLLY